jgi:signal transduction histidine kinase
LDVLDFDIETLGTPGTPGPDRPRTQPIAAVALVIAVVSGILVALELVRPIHGIDASARAAIETTIAVAAIIASRLLMEIFGRTRQLRELLLVLGVLALSLADFSYWAGPVITGARSSAPGDAVRLIWAMAGALALAGAALTSPTSIVRPLHRRARTAIIVGASALVAETLLAQVITVHATRTESTTAHVVAVGAQVLAAGIMAVAALAFAARSWRAERGTELIAGASLLFAAAGVQFMSVPFVPADWVTPREGARLVAFAVLLGGVCIRYASVQRHHAHTAICSERERAARDLHDGLAQDLACIATQAQRFDCNLGPEHPLVLATRDALVELRGMIADLTASTAATSEEAVGLVARELGRRFDLEVTVRTEEDAAPAVDGGLELRSRNDLIRATREAVKKAAVGGRGRHVDLSLSRQAGKVLLHVSDGIPEPRPVGLTVTKRRTRMVSRWSAGRSRRAGQRRPV